LGRSGDRDFGVPDSYHGGRHLDSGITRPAYSPQQQYHPAVAGAGRSAGPAWASTARVRNSSGVEYDPRGESWYGGRNSRGPWTD
jgi:hypothetical protein